MGKFWKKYAESDLLGSPEETMGFSREFSALKESFYIKKYDFSNLEQVEEIKKELLGKRILILNARNRRYKIIFKRKWWFYGSTWRSIFNLNTELLG
jgi:SepF-like predicted cell division protein (DUF552 family)